MTNGTEAADPGSANLAEIVRLAPEKTVRTWVKTCREKHDIPAPETEDLETYRAWLLSVFSTYGPLPTVQEEQRHPIFEKIGELHLLADPYAFLGFLEKYGLKISSADLQGDDEVLAACLAYLKTERFQEFYIKIRDLEEDERRRRKEDRRNIYVTGRRLRDLTELSLDALLIANDPPAVFARSGQICRIVRDENGNPVIGILGKNGVRHVLERCAEYWKFTVKGDRKPIYPPDEVVEDLMEVSEMPLPPLAGIMECPTILENNQIIDSPGYNPDTRLYYAPLNGLKINVPERPIQTDVKEAVDLLQEIFCDFPFDSEVSRTNVIGALCTAVLRPTIGDCCPMCIIDKPQIGTGASIITDVISLVVSGRCAHMTTAPRKEEEWRKKILSILLAGNPVIVFDNIEGKLQSAALASALTARIFSDRILGRSEEIRVENNATWFGTGNNVDLDIDILRRCFLVRIDAVSARPWQRTGFRHPDLRAWVISERGRILSAILTLARAWILAGRPEPRNIPILGSFERWRFIVGGIMEFSGMNDLLGNLEDMYAETDSETPQWEWFFERWYEIWRDAPIPVSEINQRLLMETDSTNYHFAGSKLADVLPDYLADAWSKKRSFVSVLGKSLTKRKGRVLPNGYMLKKMGTMKRAVLWQISKKSDSTKKVSLGELGEGGISQSEKTDPKILPRIGCSQPHQPLQAHLCLNEREGSR